MRFQIKSKEKKECKKALDEFCGQLEETYEKEIGKSVPNMVKDKVPLVMTASYEEDKNGFVLLIPLEIPKGLGLIFYPVKKKMTKQLESYFKEKKIKASVKYIGN